MIKRFLLLLLTLTLGLSCSPTEPQDSRLIKLVLEDVSCTEAWIQLTVNNLQLPAELKFYKNDVAQNNILCYGDTLLYVDSLLPNQTYNFKLSGIGNPLTDIRSNEITVTTMDTTSHNFTFQSWTFGGTAGSSVLYDVAIISPDNIWAVGEINIADTSANGYTIYNVVHWDGNEWELKRIMFKTICGQPSSQNAYPASSIIAFSENEIWVAQRGDQIAKIENGIQTQTICMPWTFQINKIWGTGSNDLYVVGNNGNIAHYNGSQWSRIESGTDLNIYDIWGEQSASGEYEILCVAAEHFVGPQRKILSIKNNSVQEISTSNISVGSLYGVWFKSGRKYYVVGNGIYTKENINNTYSWTSLHNGLTPYYTYAIKGTAFNNIFICGSFGESLFFNGLSWTTFRNTPGFYDVEFYMADIKHNIIAAVGYNGNKGFVTIGKR